MLTKTLLFAGIFSSALYVAMNFFIPLGFEGYSHITYTVSELSAIGAPTRPLWVPLAMLYILSFAGFGWGVLRVAHGNLKLRILGFLILGYAILNIYWPPMHPRGVEPSLTDTFHIVWSFIAVTSMVLMMGFGAAGFGNGFRVYTFITMALLFTFGFLTSLEAPNIPKNLPTPWIGLWERIMIALFLAWVVVLAITMLKKYKTTVPVKVK